VGPDSAGADDQEATIKDGRARQADRFHELLLAVALILAEAGEHRPARGLAVLAALLETDSESEPQRQEVAARVLALGSPDGCLADVRLDAGDGRAPSQGDYASLLQQLLDTAAAEFAVTAAP
jgi:hypothetical protein